MANTKITTKTNLSDAFDSLQNANPLLSLQPRKLMNGVEYKVFNNAPKTMRDLFDVIGMLHGDFPFLLDQGNQLTYSQVVAKTKNLANYLTEHE